MQNLILNHKKLSSDFKLKVLRQRQATEWQQVTSFREIKQVENF